MSLSHDEVVPFQGERGWHQLCNHPDFVKWQYGDSPYRVVVTLGERGHYRALFTSWYNSQSYLIRGACGGGSRGRMVAVAAANEFMRENAHGCPPPGQFK